MIRKQHISHISTNKRPASTCLDEWTRRTRGGQAVITAVVFFLIGSLVMVLGISSPVLRDVRTVNALSYSKQSFFLAEGVTEDVVYRIKNGLPVSSVETLVEGEISAAATVTTITDRKEVIAVGDQRSRIRKIKTVVVLGEGVNFNYGVQADVGGFDLDNNSSVSGNVYSNGPVEGENSNNIGGDVVSAGPTGLIDGITVDGSAYANTIEDSNIGGDAYYQTISNTTVGGIFYPNSPDQATTSLPISDELIAQWEQDAEDSGVINCSGSDYDIEDDITLPPVKINCDLDISGNPTVTLTGTVWVVGDIEVENTATVRIDPSVGNKSVAMIADNPADRLTSSTIELKNNTVFAGSGGDNSYVLMISQNNSAENNGGEEAIDISNSVIGDLLIYAAHGEIEIENNVSLKEVAGYEINLKNFAKVTYESGLANLLFTTGPSGGFSIDSWREIE